MAGIARRSKTILSTISSHMKQYPNPIAIKSAAPVFGLPQMQDRSAPQRRQFGYMIIGNFSGRPAPGVGNTNRYTANAGPSVLPQM
jgi:hypothetical protein